MSKGEDVIKNLALLKNLSRNGISLTNYRSLVLHLIHKKRYL